jgi:amino acid transporter
MPHLLVIFHFLEIPPGLLIIHGMLNSLNTRHLARFTSGMVFINLGTTAIIIIVLLATTPRSEMHPAGYVFGSAGVVNQTGGWPTGLAFLMGLLSVQWTVSCLLNVLRVTLSLVFWFR